jgi:short-subunit dehydrogenase
LSKHILITGISGGIGKAMAKEFLDHGHSVSGIDIIDTNFEELKNMGIHAHLGDVTDRDSCNELFEKIHAEAYVDIVINNAGISQIGMFDEFNDDDFDKILDINLTSIVRSCRFWINKFNTGEGGTIVNIASAAGHIPSAKLAHYVTTKFGVVGLTQALQIEAKENNWKVNFTLVSPGFVRTPLMKIGEEDGFPKSLEFLVTEPEECAKSIFDGVMSKEEHIVPTMSGKAMMTMRRLMPSVTDLLQSWALKKK